MSTALERQIRPIYDALDTGSNKSAIVTCNKLLKKHPKNDLIRALKALALVRSQKVEEALVLCDEVLASRTTDDSVLAAMTHVLRGLGRHKDMVSMFEDAFKQLPTNEDLGTQTFQANVRAGNWKSAQLTATKMYKQFQEERYLYWSVMSAILQANDPTTAPNMRDLLYNLAHRLVTSSPTPSYANADRFHLHLVILRDLGLFDEAHKLLDSGVGQNICETSLACNEVRREIWRRRGLWKEEGKRAYHRILEKKDRNWLEFLSVLDGTFSHVVHPEGPISEPAQIACSEHIVETQDLFTNVMEEDGKKDRSGLLALLELEQRARVHGLSRDTTRMVGLMQQYFEKIGDKACCFEDLKPFVVLEDDELATWTSCLESISPSVTTPSDLRRFINVQKLLRYNLTDSQINPTTESARAELYLKAYFKALPVGSDLPTTELQPADDLALLAGNTFVNLWKLTGDEVHLFHAVTVLEFASAKSKHSFQIRLMLIRIYRIIGAPSLALEHYRVMQIKQVQHDTLSHFILSRSTTFSLAATGDLTFATECLESSQIYLSNSQETADYIVRAFTTEKYSQIPEFIAFEDQLDNSLHRDIVKMEHVRMRFTHEPITSDIIDMELIELKFIFDRYHHDNRDFEIIPNYQPRKQPSCNEQTLLFGKTEGLAWLWAFLKVYIRALQQASDLDDSVEEKLLIGDRPKLSSDPETRLPLKERLLKENEDISQLTEDELSFMKYAYALANWLEPYHNHTRPSPEAVLAETAKQTELKTGHPLKGFNTPPQNGTSGENGKKNEEPPAVKEPPELISKFFDDMQARFSDLQKNRRISETLHVAVLIQEALILFVIETLRFKTGSTVKVHKLGGLVQSFKSIRSHATSILRTISADLQKMSEEEGTAERRKHFVNACQPIIILPEIDHDYALVIAKRVTDARKKLLEGVAKGILRVCSTYSH